MELYDDDGNLVATGPEAVAAFAAHIDAVQEHNRRVLSRFKPHELARFEAWLRTRTHDAPAALVRALPAGRAPREASNRRTRGSRRGGRATSSSSDDPGADDPEPPTRRLCQFCNRDIPAGRSPRARYCSDQHADRDRQRRKRQRDRERDVRPPTPQPVDFWRMRELTDEELARLRQLAVCDCNGRHLEFEPGECFRCGHWLPRGVAA